MSEMLDEAMEEGSRRARAIKRKIARKIGLNDKDKNYIKERASYHLEDAGSWPDDYDADQIAAYREMGGNDGS